MKRRYLIVIAVLVLLLCGFWPRISKTATGIAQKTIQIVSSTGTVLGTGGANAGPAPAEVVNVVDSTNHIVDTFGATQPFACSTNNASCLTQADTGAVQRNLIELDSNNFLQIGGAGVLQINMTATNNVTTTIGGVQMLSLALPSVNVKNGATLQSSGGTAPTATCSGGSTGVVVNAGNTSCTASVTPFPCCTGSGTGTCSGATNNRGLILTSSSASTNCTLTWSVSGTWAQAPGCSFTDGSASITPVAFAEGNCGTSTCVFDFASASSKVVQWVCM